MKSFFKTNRGAFKAIIVTGGPGSGKDIIVREAFAGTQAVELNAVQAYEYLMDKQKLSEQSKDFRKEAIRNRKLLIINGTADNFERISSIKEELEELGYSTMMIYVDTMNDISKQRNESLKRMISEAVREEKWQKAQVNKVKFHSIFNDFNLFENNDNLESIEDSIVDVCEHVNDFLKRNILNEISEDWLLRNKKLNINEEMNLLFKGMENAKNTGKDSKSIQKRNLGAKSGRDRTKLLFDNSCPSCEITRKAGRQDSVKDGDVASNSGYAFRTYEQAKGKDTTKTTTKESTEGTTKGASLKVNPVPKETNFQQDKEKVKGKKMGRWRDVPSMNQRMRNTTGIGPEFDTRQQGTVYPMSGLGDVTYREDREITSDKYVKEGTAAGSRKAFSQFRTTKVSEAIDDPGAVDMGVGGTLGGATNKEPMQTYKDQDRNIGITIKKKKKQEK